MGGAISALKIPPIIAKDLRTVLSYNLTENAIKKVFKVFQEMDVDGNGVWTVSEMYKTLKEPRLSVRAPVIDTIFFMGDSESEGSLNFPDFLVTMCSFCALSKEEMLQFLFMIIDVDRNGTIEKEELLNFFSYMPAGTEDSGEAPVFPVNNKNALDKFRGGKWERLQFDGLAQLCELFPYIAYPAYHTQEMYRAAILGTAFWKQLDFERIKYQTVQRTKRVRMPFSKKRVDIKTPGRVTMQELLEYSRRKTTVQGGKRVASSAENTDAESALAKDRDDQIMRSPILNMIRNPRCMYYVPLESNAKAIKQKQNRSELDVGMGDYDIQQQELKATPSTPAVAGDGIKSGAPSRTAERLALVNAMQIQQAQRERDKLKEVESEYEEASESSYSGDDSDLTSRRSSRSGGTSRKSGSRRGSTRRSRSISNN
eukprot:TRINITY_DN61825_c0_g1_i1.p1 TRINITY_DN61825_c0_g1~~TRINITY_DN61825_c0_g1_i1.p1  ORF type:complete len:427 (+),score=84.40 TRINITY_DN61825_c0_g1_i1:99-1379(+)